MLVLQPWLFSFLLTGRKLAPTTASALELSCYRWTVHRRLPGDNALLFLQSCYNYCVAPRHARQRAKTLAVRKQIRHRDSFYLK